MAFTEGPIINTDLNADSYFVTDKKGYPNETLFRYQTILKARWKLEEFDQIFFADADMLFVAPVGDIYSDGLVATLHPGYIGRKGTPEYRPESMAFCSTNERYFCGGFQGGDAMTYIRAMEEMAQNISIDDRRGITAVWHDESHWNKYLETKVKPKKVLTPSYCYPEGYEGKWGWAANEYPPILMALDKTKRGNHPRCK